MVELDKPSGDPPAHPPPPPAAPTGYQAPREVKVREWAMYIHLAQFAGFIIPFGHIVGPLVLWQIKKTEFPENDPHGVMAVNWGISSVIWAIVCLPAILLFGLGVIGLVALFVCGIVFPILGGLRARDGILWKYPLTIPFLK